MCNESCADLSAAGMIVSQSLAQHCIADNTGIIVVEALR